LTHIPALAATKKCNPHHPRVNQPRQKWREQLRKDQRDKTEPTSRLIHFGLLIVVIVGAGPTRTP
jgi:hypothetical protein